MTRVNDPVCGMTFDQSAAAEKIEFAGTIYHFCSPVCAQMFEANPQQYAGGDATSATPTPVAVERGERVELERHEPPRTTSGWLTSPKFGAAGSGGLEYELAPEVHGSDGHRH